MPFDRWDSDGGSGPFLLDLCNVENECSFAADLLVLPLFGTIWKWKFLDHQTNIYMMESSVSWDFISYLFEKKLFLNAILKFGKLGT